MGLGWSALVEMAIFLAMLTAGLAYAWALGALKWQ
jgi:NADH:ubiquinone oxidoreductase subunit 3 (subunit A)